MYDNKIFLYTISESYIDKLRSLDTKVQRNYNEQRVYFKTKITSSLNNGEIDYYIPLSSAKKKQLSINNKSVFKIFGGNKKEDFLGVLHINNLIPVPKSEAKPWNSKNKLDEQYKMLIIKQAKVMWENKDKINEYVQIIYDSKTNRLDKDYFKKNRKNVMVYKKITNEIEMLETLYKKEIRKNKNE